MFAKPEIPRYPSCMKTKILLLAVLLLLCHSKTSAAVDLLGASEEAVSEWAKEKGYTVNDSNRGTTGCLSGKRYVELVKGNLKLYAIFYQPIYKEHSQKVTLVMFQPASSVGQGQARQWAVQVAPIVGTRPGTHHQKLESGAGICEAKNGGFEERYTGDFLVEYQYGAGGSGVERLFISNEGIR